MVSCTPSLDRKMPIGFMILWFYGFVHSISGHRDDDRFHGFLVSWFISPCTPSLDRFLGFMVSWFHGFVHCISGQQDADRFHGFVVSWFRALHLWTAICWHVSWFQGFVQSISGQRDGGRFLDFNILLSRNGVHGEINHETTKPIAILMSRDAVHKTMKPWNHESKKPVNILLSRDEVHREINH